MDWYEKRSFVRAKAQRGMGNESIKFAELAKHLGMSKPKLEKWLENEGIQTYYKNGNPNLDRIVYLSDYEKAYEEAAAREPQRVPYKRKRRVATKQATASLRCERTIHYVYCWLAKKAAEQPELKSGGRKALPKAQQEAYETLSQDCSPSIKKGYIWNTPWRERYDTALAVAEGKHKEDLVSWFAKLKEIEAEE